jgi:hypothetical protein
MDVFLEYMVKKKKSSRDILNIALFVFGAIVVSYLGLAIGNLLKNQGIGLLIVAAGWYGMYYFTSLLNIEYEYAVTNGELDIDKIMGQKKRKRIITVKPKNIELLAHVNDERFQNQYNNPNLKAIDVSSGNVDVENIYFIIFSKDGQKLRIVFEPTDKMLKSFKQHSPQNVFLPLGKEGDSK